MVDLNERLAQVKVLVDEGKYFTINRARQFGKTTTLHELAKSLNNCYFVVSMDFQMQMSNAKFKNENSFSVAFAKAFIASFKSNEKSREPYCEAAIKDFSDSFTVDTNSYELVELFQSLSALCNAIPMGVVLMIDEVDSATNNQVFLDFLAQLRGYYINRSRFSTFKSVILAGVCDIKNLKRKLRPDEEHKDNSPWNTREGNESSDCLQAFDDCSRHQIRLPVFDVAADFDIDMSFSAEQIQTMLESYETDHKSGIKAKSLAKEIFDYTDGYPYLVSRLCQLLDYQYQENGKKNSWKHENLLQAVRDLVKESNSLFDDMAKKVKDFPELKALLYDILFCGKSIPFNLNTELVAIGNMFGFLKDEEGQI